MSCYYDRHKIKSGLSARSYHLRGCKSTGLCGQVINRTELKHGFSSSDPWSALADKDTRVRVIRELHANVKCRISDRKQRIHWLNSRALERMVVSSLSLNVRAYTHTVPHYIHTRPDLCSRLHTWGFHIHLLLFGTHKSEPALRAGTHVRDLNFAPLFYRMFGIVSCVT